MNNSHIFSQILAKISWENFDRIVRTHNGDKAVKSHSCKDLFTTLMFSQISGADSLREISQGLASQGSSLNHLGIEKAASHSSLGYALANRPWEVFRDLFLHLVNAIQPKLSKKRGPNGLKSQLFSVDSTTIDLCLAMYPWAKFHHKKGAVKIHTILSHAGLIPVFAHVAAGRIHDVRAFKDSVLTQFTFPKGSIVAIDKGYIDYGLFSDFTENGVTFVTRIKDNAVFEETKIRSKSKDTSEGAVRRDVEIVLTRDNGKACPHTLRAVTIWVEDKKQEMTILTNNLDLAGSTIGKIYKQRWQVELFFKQIKQNLKIKSFLGTSENAVKSQIYAALCTTLLMQSLKNDSDSIRVRVKQKTFSYSNMVTMLRINLFRYHDLGQWLANPFIEPNRHAELQSVNLDLFGQHRPNGLGVPL